MPEIPHKVRPMLSAESYASEARAWIQDEVASRRGLKKQVLSEIAREVGLHVRRIAAHFHGEVRSPSAAEFEALRHWRRAAALRRLQTADREMAELRRQLADMGRDDDAARPMARVSVSSVPRDFDPIC